MNWFYKGEVFNPASVANLYGFTYKLVYEYNNQEYTYYGKKIFNSIREIDALKNNSCRNGHLEFIIRRRNGKNVRREIVAKESNWNKYSGSCKDERIASMVLISKDIIDIVELQPKCKQTLTYLEEKLLFDNNVLLDEYNFNSNIGGRYFKGNIIGSVEC